MKKAFLLILVLSCSSWGCVSHKTDAEIEQVSRVLDQLHQAASEARGEEYFGLFADEAIFMGTDDTERWTLEQFKSFALPYFAKGTGWTHTKRSRNIFISKDQKVAWFDEQLSNQKLGACRGSGVLVKIGGSWKIAQYNLSLPIPNALAESVVTLIQKGK